MFGLIVKSAMQTLLAVTLVGTSVSHVAVAPVSSGLIESVLISRQIEIQEQSKQERAEVVFPRSALVVSDDLAFGAEKFAWNEQAEIEFESADAPVTQAAPVGAKSFSIDAIARAVAAAAQKIAAVATVASDAGTGDADATPTADNANESETADDATEAEADVAAAVDPLDVEAETAAEETATMIRRNYSDLAD